jgi:MYXO-CTERM domain-containing protein
MYVCSASVLLQLLITAAMCVPRCSAGGGDGSETLLLLGLLAVLVLVLRRRAALRTLYGPPPGPLPGPLLAESRCRRQPPGAPAVCQYRSTRSELWTADWGVLLRLVC